MMRYCMDLPDGGLRHFPAGTYNEQVRNETGRVELALMNKVYSVWLAFKYLTMSKWGENERKLAGWMMPVKKKEEPSRRLDTLISRLWGPSWWLTRVMRTLRRD